MENPISMSAHKPEKFRLMCYLAQGILPFEQWSCVFANPDVDSKPGLICKAFAVWFPTMLDYLRRPEEVDATIRELSGDREADEAVQLSRTLGIFFKRLLTPFSREEQIFINDRRLQNVHGILSTFRLDRIHTKHYSADADEVLVEHMDADKYHEIMRNYYPQMQVHEMALRNKLVTTDLFREFGLFYMNNLKTEPHLVGIATRLGVSSHE